MKLPNQRRQPIRTDANGDPVLDVTAVREAFAAVANGNRDPTVAVAPAMQPDRTPPHSELTPQLFGFAPAAWKQPVAEGFRLLALNVMQFLSRSSRRTVVVMSPFAGDGRSWTAASLAKALSDLRAPVTLVDADGMGSGFGELVHPAWVHPASAHPAVRPGSVPTNDVDLYNRWGIRTRTRFADGHNGNLRESDLKNGAPRLWLMQPNRSRISRQADLVPVVSSILEEGDRAGLSMVVDTPACTASSLGFSLASEAAGVVYVARLRAKGGASVHREVRAQLDFLGAIVIGIVLNEF